MPARKPNGRADDCSLQRFGAFGTLSGKEDIMNQEKSAITAARMINCVDDHHQRLFIDGLLAGLSEARRLQWMQLVCEMAYPDLVWKDLEAWLEKKFGRDPRKTPQGDDFFFLRGAVLEIKTHQHLVYDNNKTET